MRELFKRYVDVEVRFDKEGHMKPEAIYWPLPEGEKRFPIDMVIAEGGYCPAKVGGAGRKYTVLIQGEKRDLYRENCKDAEGRPGRRWFIESLRP